MAMNFTPGELSLGAFLLYLIVEILIIIYIIICSLHKLTEYLKNVII